MLWGIAGCYGMYNHWLKTITMSYITVYNHDYSMLYPYVTSTASPEVPWIQCGFQGCQEPAERQGAEGCYSHGGDTQPSSTKWCFMGFPLGFPMVLFPMGFPMIKIVFFRRFSYGKNWFSHGFSFGESCFSHRSPEDILRFSYVLPTVFLWKPDSFRFPAWTWWLLG